MTGTTGSGKSSLALELLLSARAPRLIVDPSHSDLFDLRGIETFRDPAKPPDGAATARFVPRDPQDADAYDRVYRWAWQSYPRYLLLDESGVAAPARGSSRWVRTLVIQGRKRQLGHVACHTRPREVDENLKAQAAHLIVFALPAADDVKHLAGYTGLTPQLLGEHLDALPEHGFLWWDQRRRKLTICPPIKARAHA